MTADVGPDETVYVPQNRRGGSYSVFHTDPDCSRLQRAEKVRDKKRRHTSPNLRLCRECEDGGGYGHGTSPTDGYVDDLEAAEPGDLLPDGGQCVDDTARYGKSPVTGQWYRVTEWEDVGDGKMVAKSKEPVDEDEVPKIFRGSIEWSLSDTEGPQ